MYGVGGTSLTGTYNPGPPPSTFIVGIANNMDGTYDVQWSGAVNLNNPGSVDQAVIIRDPGTQTWQAANLVIQTAFNTIRVQQPSLLTTCNEFAIVSTPSFITANPPLKIPDSSAI